MPTLERADARVAYDVAGDGPAVVLVHNIFCHRGVFTELAHALRREFRVVTLDLRGHGASPIPARRYDIATLADDVVAILDHEGIARASLVGLSIGATVALELALAHPARVERLVLMGADPAASTPFVHLRNLLFCLLVRLVGMRGFILATVAGILFGATFRRSGAARYAALHAHLRALPARAAVLAMRAWSGRRSLVSSLSAITAPSLVVVGDEDASCPLPCGQALVRGLPDARLTRLAAAGHSMTAEQPDAATRVVTAFLRGQG